MSRFPDHSHCRSAEPNHRDYCLSFDMELVSLELTAFSWLKVSCNIIITFGGSRNEVHAIIYAACIPTVMPIITRSSMKLPSWISFRARHHKINISDGVLRLGSIDGATSPSKRRTCSSSVEDGRIGSNGPSDKKSVPELDFSGYPGDLQATVL